MRPWFFTLLVVACSDNTKPGPLVDVVVAAVPIAAGAPISLEVLARRQVPETFASGNVARSTDVPQLLGRTTLIAFEGGDPILLSALGPASADGGLPAQIQAAHRAVWLDVNTSVSLATVIRPGDRVDILFSLRDPLTSAQTVVTPLQDRLVLAVRAKAIALELSPEESGLATLGTELGVATVALRAAGDHSRSDAGAATLESLLPSGRNGSRRGAE